MCQLTQSEDVHGDDMQVDLICTEPAQISRNDKVPKAVTYCRYLDPHATALRSLGVVQNAKHGFCPKHMQVDLVCNEHKFELKSALRATSPSGESKI